MNSPQRKLFSKRAQSLLAQFDATAETVKFVAKDGPLAGEIRAFLVSVAAMVKRDCKIQDWKHDLQTPDDDAEDAGYTYVRLFPKSWNLTKVGPVAFCVYWINPFLEDADDLCVYLRIPWGWSNADSLKDLVLSSIPEGFTNVYDGEADASTPFWRYLRFRDFVNDSGLDVDTFYQEILSAFSSLLPLRPVIDEYISQCVDVPEVRTARRELGVVAVVDTETAGSPQELIELAVVNAAYDKQSGEVLGILEQYEGLREPKCGISKADQRFNNLGSEQVRGQKLDETRIRSLLARADLVVAHNASFDQARLEEQCGWAVDLLKGKWRDSLNGVAWETDTRDLQSLLTHHGVDCEVEHRAGPDARALLELLSYGGSGRTYLAQLLTDKAKGQTI